MLCQEAKEGLEDDAGQQSQGLECTLGGYEDPYEAQGGQGQDPKGKKKKRSQRVSAPSLLDLPTVLTPSLGNMLVPQISGSKASAKA